MAQAEYISRACACFWPRLGVWRNSDHFGAKLQDLVVFVGSKGYLDDEYVLVTSFPKRVLNDMNQSLTLADVKLSAREQIHVQER
jgi:hypothetical protein